MFRWLSLCFVGLPRLFGALADSCPSGADSCHNNEDSSLLQLHHDEQMQQVLDWASEEFGGPVWSSEDRFNLQGKSVYLVMPDRFNRVGGYSAGDTTECNSSYLYGWCNGTFAGIREQLPYIKDMGFDCIWVTPVVENPAVEDAPPGQSPSTAKAGDFARKGTPDWYKSQSGWGYHGYWAQNYYKTDPHFGTNEDLKELVKSVHQHGMCFVLDIVMNHMGPIHPYEPLRVEKKIPFNKPEYYHQLGRGNRPWDEYTEKYALWPLPAQSMGAGTLCYLETNSTTGKSDYTNNNNYCNNYVNAPPYNSTTYLGKEAAGPPEIMYCGPGNYCKGYNQTLVWEGWFYDLGDLNHSHPFVVEKQLEWIEWVKSEFDIDAIRLDTAPYMPWTFLQKLQETAHPVQIHGEVTTTNISFHASFQKYPERLAGGYKVLAGMENFPANYMATPGYCGYGYSPSSPVATWDLSLLGRTMTEQIQEKEKGNYVTLDGLMNFMDNQDETAMAQVCKQDESRIKNSLTWVFFCYGIPTVMWGTEQGNLLQRNSLWQYGWNTTTWQYQFIKTLNSVRKKADVRFMKTEVVKATTTILVFKRFCPVTRREVWIFTNSLSTMQGSGEVTYPVAPSLPRKCKGPCFWVDAFTGRRADINLSGNLVAPNSDPLVLVLSKSTW